MNAFRIDADGLLSVARQIPSSNYDERAPGLPIELVVIHNISLPPGQFGGNGVVELFTNCLDPAQHPYYQEIHQLRVSSHFFIRRDGELLVPHGNTKLCSNDRLTLVGSIGDIEIAKQRFSEP